LPFI
ncbi:hypothetical protein BN1723_020792, partial [Verticillium longisporum]|jgi:hypothetical protein